GRLRGGATQRYEGLGDARGPRRRVREAAEGRPGDRGQAQRRRHRCDVRRVLPFETRRRDFRARVRARPVTIAYTREQDLSVEDYVTVIGSTYMAGRRPVGNPARVAEMLAGSNFIVAARGRTGAIVGLARGMTDNAWVCYLADVCVRDGWQ